MSINLSKLQEIVKGTGKPGILQFMESQRVGHDLATEQQQQQNSVNAEVKFHIICSNSHHSDLIQDCICTENIPEL